MFEAYEGLGGALVIGQDPESGKWFWGGRLGLGLGGGLSFDYKGKRPGADEAKGKNTDCGQHTTVGTFGSLGASLYEYQLSLVDFAGGHDFGTGRSYSESSVLSGLTFGNGIGLDLGVSIGVEVIGYQ